PDLRHCLAPAGEYSNSVGLNGCIALKNAIICGVGPELFEKSIARPCECRDTDPDPAVRAPGRRNDVIVRPYWRARACALPSDPPAFAAPPGAAGVGAIKDCAFSITPESSFDPAPLAMDTMSPTPGIDPATESYTFLKMDDGSFSASATKSTPSSTLSSASPAKSVAERPMPLTLSHALPRMPPPANPPCIRDANPIPRRPAALAARNA